MLDGELLGRQRRPEIGVVLAYDPQNRSTPGAAVLRLLARPPFFETKPAAPSRRNAFSNRHTWRSLRSNSCAAALIGSPPRSTSRNTSRRRSSASLTLSTATDIAPTARQTAAETDISKLDGTDICTLPLHEVLPSVGL